MKNFKIEDLPITNERKLKYVIHIENYGYFACGNPIFSLHISKACFFNSITSAKSRLNYYSMREHYEKEKITICCIKAIDKEYFYHIDNKNEEYKLISNFIVTEIIPFNYKKIINIDSLDDL